MHSLKPLLTGFLAAALIFMLSTSVPGWSSEGTTTSAGYNIAEYTGPKDELIKQIFPRSTRLVPPEEPSGLWEVYQLGQLLGYAFESIHLANLPGFAGDPINLLVGLDTTGNLVDVKILAHSEPIFLHGLGPEPLIEFVNQYKGLGLAKRIQFKSGRSGPYGDEAQYIDGVTKATVTVMVINDVILSSALTVARQKIDAFAQKAAAKVNTEFYESKAWHELLDEQLIRKWIVKKSDVEAVMGRSLDNYNELDAYVDPDDPDETLTLYSMYLNAPVIGRNILGDKAFERLNRELKPGEHAFAVMSEGFYDILGPNFREGTIPERISIFQNGLAIPMRDMAFLRFQDAKWPEDMPLHDNLLVYKIRPQAGFNPAAPYGLALHFDLARNHLIRDQGSLSDNFQLPPHLFLEAEFVEEEKRVPLWVQLWEGRVASIAILLIGLTGILYLFLRQERFIAPGAHLKRWRYLALIFTTGFIGFYAQGQLSVINIYTFLLELFDDFDITIFLLDPVIFILWIVTFVSLFLFGRGLFCGWLCPFGALQEFASDLGKKLKLKQITVPARWDHALRYLKYIVLLAVVGSAFLSAGTAEVMAEVEPFKTAITLNFVRYWPFAVYAVGLLVISAFVHKAYCRYICPLGAGLAILGAFPIFKWLTRRAECGTPCQLCRHKCEIGAIRKSGEVDYLECVQCLECVRILEDPLECAPRRVEAKRAKTKQNTDQLQFVEVK